MSEPTCEQLTLFQEDFPASPIASQENDWLPLMSEIYGMNAPESFARLTQDGSWVKTLKDCCQVKMDGSLEEFSGTWPYSGIVQNGIAFLLPPLVPPILGIERFCWLSTPTASMTVPSESVRDSNRLPSPAECTGRFYVRSGKKMTVPGGCSSPLETGSSSLMNPEFAEWLMGYPIGWSDCTA